MPGTAEGWALARFVKRLYPEMPVVLMSGYVGEAEVRVAQAPEIDHFIPKPVKLFELPVVFGELLEEM